MLQKRYISIHQEYTFLTWLRNWTKILHKLEVDGRVDVKSVHSHLCAFSKSISSCMQVIHAALVQYICTVKTTVCMLSKYQELDGEIFLFGGNRQKNIMRQPSLIFSHLTGHTYSAYIYTHTQKYMYICMYTHTRGSNVTDVTCLGEKWKEQNQRDLREDFSVEQNVAPHSYLKLFSCPPACL